MVKQSQTEEHGRAPRRCSCASGSRRRSRTLKQKRRSGHSLYDLPWYVIIGAPGSGKTTALVNSGLHFPARAAIGQGRAARRRRHAQLRLVVHRRSGVPRHRRPLHDAGFRRRAPTAPAGRSSSRCCASTATRRPINGVILTISAQDLMMQGHGGARGARRRGAPAAERAEPGAADPAAGLRDGHQVRPGRRFTEYFDDLTQEGRAQVWGVTFPYEQTQQRRRGARRSPRSSTR